MDWKEDRKEHSAHPLDLPERDEFRIAMVGSTAEVIYPYRETSTIACEPAMDTPTVTRCDLIHLPLDEEP